MRKMLVLALTLLLAACGGSPSRTDDRRGPDPEPETQEPVWREDQKPADPKVEKKPAEPAKPADPKVEKKPAEPPKPADPKVEKKPAEPAKPADPKVEKKPAEPAKPADPKVEKKPEEPPRPVGPLTNKELLADEFIEDVKGRLSALEDTKSFKHAKQEFKHFNDKLDKVLTERKQAKPNQKNIEKAWAECIKAWFQARYALLLFLHLHTPDKEFMTVFIHERAEVLALSDAELKSAACRASQAAAEVSSEMSRELGRFQGDYLKNDLVCSQVYQDKTMQKTWEDDRKKWSDAAEGKIDSKELQRFKD
ncbi:MAG: hypothetical protein KF754_06690 [Planctomycetes bacterium]|nr:hypothetical protein [Planctomycetota bacterium]